MKRLSATTMVELIVVMLLSTILFSAAMLMYKIIQAQYDNYATLTEKTWAYDDLHHLLYQDIWKAEQVQVLDDELYCWMDNHEVTYFVQEPYVLRQMQEQMMHTDTFHFVETRLETYFKGYLIDEGLVDKVVLTIPTIEDRTKQFIFTKTYDYTTLEQNSMNYGN